MSPERRKKPPDPAMEALLRIASANAARVRAADLVNIAREALARIKELQQCAPR